MSKRYDLARLITLALLLGLVSLFLLPPVLFGPAVAEGLAVRLGLRQDLPILPVFLAAALLTPAAGPLRRTEWLANSRALLILSVCALLVLGYAGHYLVFQDYDLSRDEQMAVFDQQIFAQGRVLWPIPQDWRFLADALNRRFMLPIGANEYWVSAYLPVHSAFRALVGSVDAALASPLMAALAAVSLWSVARKLWPQSTSTAGLALLLLVTSSQVLITSMTAFSMSMHLALNMLWLTLFLTDRPKAHAAAIGVGFLATGIHQPLFHPLFVLPFLFLLLQQRRWRLLAVYLGSYAAIGLFWLAWPLWITSHGAAAAANPQCGVASNCNAGSYVGRLIGTVTAFDLHHLWLTAANLLRFVCWQHPLLLPLAIFGTMACWRSEPLVRALAVGLLLPIVVMAVVLPWQGHGWGYRYVHPVLGNAILLACYGWRALADKSLSMQRPLAITTALALLLVPVHAVMARRMVAPFTKVYTELTSIDADAVIVDTELAPFGQDVVLNRFDLSNRPKLLIALLVKPGDLARLCKRSTIAFYDAPRLGPLNSKFGLPTPKEPSPEARRLHEVARTAGCRVVGGNG